MNIAFVGEGPDKTTLFKGERIRFEALRIDCQNAPCIDVRVSGAVHLRIDTKGCKERARWRGEGADRRGPAGLRPSVTGEGRRAGGVGSGRP